MKERVVDDLNKTKSNLSLQQIQNKIDQEYKTITSKVPGLVKITAQDLFNYFDGEAPSGDTTTVADVLENRFLLIHEIVEIAILKMKNLQISADLLYTEEDEVEKAHIVATIHELEIAKEIGKTDWIHRRVANIENWEKYPELPTKIKNECKRLFSQYKQYFT